MLLNGIEGMDRVMTGDVRPPYITLVTGPPGAMKTGFALTIMSNHLSRTGEFGLYCTIEETVESLLRGAESLGIHPPHNLQITDFTELRRENSGMDYLKFTRRMIEHFKQQHGERFHEGLCQPSLFPQQLQSYVHEYDQVHSLLEIYQESFLLRFQEFYMQGYFEINLFVPSIPQYEQFHP